MMHALSRNVQSAAFLARLQLSLRVTQSAIRMVRGVQIEDSQQYVR